jgi:hypothetical protein
LTIRVSIGLLCVGAAVLIVLIAGKSDFSDSILKALTMVLVAVLFLLTAMAGVTLVRDRAPSPVAWVGSFTVATSGLALLGVSVGIWDHLDSDPAKLTASVAVLALAGAHASLLLGPGYERDSANIRALRNGTLGALAMLALLAVYLISEGRGALNGDEFAVVAILYVLGTTVLPLARRLGR